MCFVKGQLKKLEFCQKVAIKNAIFVKKLREKMQILAKEKNVIFVKEPHRKREFCLRKVKKHELHQRSAENTEFHQDPREKT